MSDQLMSKDCCSIWLNLGIIFTHVSRLSLLSIPSCFLYHPFDPYFFFHMDLSLEHPKPCFVVSDWSPMIFIQPFWWLGTSKTHSTRLTALLHLLTLIVTGSATAHDIAGSSPQNSSETEKRSWEVIEVIRLFNLLNFLVVFWNWVWNFYERENGP